MALRWRNAPPEMPQSSGTDISDMEDTDISDAESEPKSNNSASEKGDKDKAMNTIFYAKVAAAFAEFAEMKARLTDAEAEIAQMKGEQKAMKTSSTTRRPRSPSSTPLAEQKAEQQAAEADLDGADAEFVKKFIKENRSVDLNILADDSRWHNQPGYHENCKTLLKK